MINPVQISLIKDDGTRRPIIIQPILTQSNGGLTDTGTYKVYKDAFGEESALFTEPLEINEQNNNLADELNPDYLGKVTYADNVNFKYDGDLLSVNEQKQLTDHLTHLHQSG